VTEDEPLIPVWDTFERDYVAGGIPHAIVVRTDPQAAIFVDEFAARLGVRFRRDHEPAWTGPNPLIEVTIAEVLVDGVRFLEMWTDSRDLFRNFYDLATEVITEVVVEGIDPVAALGSAVARWDTLLARPSLLSDESQAGLFGELWLLERLILVHGPPGVDAWVGPDRQAHDFRVEDAEFEVKTTSGTRRVHTINGAGQLQPSPGSTLYLLSLKLTDAGSGGRTLAQAVTAIEELLSEAAEAKARFRSKLNVLRYRDADAPHYPRRRKLRERAALIRIEDGVPRLTPEVLAQIDPRFASERIDRVTYDVDVDGLGFDDGTPEFLSILPEGGAPGDCC
jgi:hypothetical protein